MKFVGTFLILWPFLSASSQEMQKKRPLFTSGIKVDSVKYDTENPQTLTFERLVELSNDDKKTKEGKKYEQEATLEIAPKVQAALVKCFIQDSPKFKFNMIFVINAAGNVVYSSANSKTGEVNCFAAKLGKVVFPSPPRSPFRLNLEIKVQD